MQVNLCNAMESEGLMLFTKLAHHKNTNTCSWGEGIIVHYNMPSQVTLKKKNIDSALLYVLKLNFQKLLSILTCAFKRIYFLLKSGEFG